MSDEKQETIEDIVAEMREYESTPPPRDAWLDLADRIEAAARAERERGAEAAQICGEIGEAIGSGRSGNAAAIREALVRCADIINKFGLAEIVKTPMEVICDIEGIITAALSAPPRNCDVPHKDDHELWLRWQAFCAEIYPSRMSFSTWLLDLAQEGGAK